MVSKSVLINPETGKKFDITATQMKFLAAYAEVGHISEAAKIAKCNRAVHYQAMKKSEDYALAFSFARQQAVEVLEIEARRRAVDGWEEPVYQGGELVGTKRKFSDILLIFLLKAANPDKYADRQKTELTVTDPVVVYMPSNKRDSSE